MGRKRWADAAPREDAHRGHAGGELLVSGLLVPRQAALSACEEPAEVRRPPPRPDSPQVWRLADRHHPATQSLDAGLVQLLPPLPLERLSGLRRNHPSSLETIAPETQPAESPSPASTTTLAERLLYRAGVPQPDGRPHPICPILRNLLTGEPYAGKPPVRFGGRGAATQCSLPTLCHSHARGDFMD